MSPFPLRFPSEFFSVQEEDEWTKNEHLGGVNDIYCWSTCTMKFESMDRKKRRGDLPCQRMESSIQRMPANFTVITQNHFCFDLPVVFSPGPQEYCWFSLPVIIKLFSGYYENQQRLRFYGKALETTALNSFWFSLNSISWFPMTPPLQVQLYCLLYLLTTGHPGLSNLSCHNINVCSLGKAKNCFIYSNHMRCD